MPDTPFKLRVFLQTRKGESIDVSGVLDWIKAVSPQHSLVIQHDADDDDARPHYHALFFSDRPVQSLRVALLKAVPSVKVNYSLQDMPSSAVDSYTRYMCHAASRGDGVKIVYAALAKYTSAWAATQNRAFWDSRTAFKQDQSKKTEDILSYCMEQAKTMKLRKVSDVGALLLDEYQSRKKTFHIAHMRHQILTIWHAVGGDLQKREVLQCILGGCENFSPMGTTSQQCPITVRSEPLPNDPLDA